MWPRAQHILRGIQNSSKLLCGVNAQTHGERKTIRNCHATKRNTKTGFTLNKTAVWETTDYYMFFEN